MTRTAHKFDVSSLDQKSLCIRNERELGSQMGRLCMSKGIATNEVSEGNSSAVPILNDDSSVAFNWEDVVISIYYDPTAPGGTCNYFNGVSLN